MWDFSKLPVDVHGEVLRLFDDRRFSELRDIYNTYRVSPQLLTPCCSNELIQQWTIYARTTGLLTDVNTEK